MGISENMAAVTKDGKWGYIGRNGEVIIPIIYDNASPFSDGLALVSLVDKNGYINTAGEIVIPIEYDYATGFQGGIAEVMKFEHGNQYHYVIDRTGGTVIGPKEYGFFTYGNGFCYAGYNEDAELTMSGGRFYALLDHEGNRLTGFNLGVFDYVREGLVVIQDADSIFRKLGIYNQYGAEIVPPLFNILNIVDNKTCLVSLYEYPEDYSHVGVLTLPEDAQTRRPNEPRPITVYLDGLDLCFDAELISANGRIMVPVRKICEALGADFTWNELEQTISVTKDETSIMFTIGNTTAFVGYNAVVLDTPAMIHNNEPLVPLRFVVETLSHSVVWETENRRVVICSD